MLHTLLSESVVEALKNGQNFTDPWQGSMGMGHPMLHYYQHLPHVGVGLAHVLTFQTLSVPEIIRWSTYGLISIFPLSIFWSLRKFGFDKLTSSMGGLIASSIATNSISGFGYSSYIGNAQGLYTQLWAMVLLPMALATGYQVLKKGRGYLWAVLLLTATFMSHFLYGYMAFLTLGILTILMPIRFQLPWNLTNLAGSRGATRADRRRFQRTNLSQTQENTSSITQEPDTQFSLANLFTRVRRLALISVLVAAVMSYFLVPFLLDFRFLNSSELLDPRLYDSHGHSAVLKGLFKGHIFDFGRFSSFTILVFIGFGICIYRSSRELYLIPVIIFILWLLLYFGRPTWGSLTNLLPFSDNILMFRFIGGVHLGGILLIAVALGFSWRWAVSKSNIWYSVAALILTLALLIPVFIDRQSTIAANSDRLDRCQQREYEENQNVNALFAELKQLPKGRIYAGRFVYNQSHWGATYRSACTLIQAQALAEGFDTMAALFHRYSMNSDILDDFDESRWEQYNLFNIRYVIAPEEQTFPEFVRIYQKFGRHVLYEVDTTGYFDLVGSELALAGQKDDLLPAVSSWLASGRPKAKLHPAISLDSSSKEFPNSLSDAAEIIAAAEVPQSPNRGTLISEQIGSNFFTANVLVERESILLLKASYHTNWRATVNGKEADTLFLMPSFVGIKLTPGEHKVRLEYKPRTLRGILLVLGLLLLPSIAIVEHRSESISGWIKLRVTDRFPSRNDSR